MTDLKHDMGEIWLAKRCGHFGRIFAGVTDPALRKQRMREAIRESALEMAICGKRGEKVETFGEVFARIYGEPP